MEREMSDSKPKANATDWSFAGFDFAKLIESCQISGVDMTALIDTEKKNIDALMEVNRSAYDGWRNLMAQQAEVFQETMKAIAASDKVAGAWRLFQHEMHIGTGPAERTDAC